MSEGGRVVKVEKTESRALNHADPDCDAVSIDLEYPRSRRCKFVEVGLCDVRAADNILVGYDFERDGWAIHQQRSVHFEGMGCSINPDPDEWFEVAFVPSWQLARDARPGEVPA